MFLELWKIKNFVYFCGSVHTISLRTLVSTIKLKVCHGFRLTKQVAYFWVDFDHF